MGPELLVLFTTKPLIVVAFALKQLLKVRSAVKFTVHCSVTAQAVEGSRNIWVRAERQGREGEKVGRPEQGRAHLSLAWQCLQQKQELWKMREE